MSNHPINLDAIQAGVEAFLQTYPDEAALDALSPTSGPKGAHAVLWMDDWWRGVDMAREALESADFCAKLTTRYPTEHLRTAACKAVVYARANGWEIPSDLRDEINRDAVAAFLAEILALCAMGATDVDGAAVASDLWSTDGRWMVPAGDLEVAADLTEPAGPPSSQDTQWWLAELAKVQAQAAEAMKRADKAEAYRRRKFPQP